MHRLLAASLVAMLALTTSLPVAAQQQTGALSGTPIGLGPRSAAMGGAFIAVADDATALYWNPAGLGGTPHLHWSNSIVGHAENLGVADEARDVYDIATQMSVTPANFDFLRRQAQQLSGKPVRGSVGAISALGFNNVALGAYAIGGGAGELLYTPGTSTGYTLDGVEVHEGEAVTVTGNALWQYNQAAGFSYRATDRLVVGATIRKMYLRTRDKTWQAEVTVSGTPPQATIQTSEVDAPTLKDDKVTADIGLLYSPAPRVKLAVVARNVTSPDFSLSDRGGTVVTPVSVDSVIDLGMAVSSEDGNRLMALDIHNIGGRNGGPSTIHFGYECQANSLLTWRLGATQSTLSAGVGLNLGVIQLAVAVGSGESDAQQAGVGIGLHF